MQFLNSCPFSTTIFYSALVYAFIVLEDRCEWFRPCRTLVRAAKIEVCERGCDLKICHNHTQSIIIMKNYCVIRTFVYHLKKHFNAKMALHWAKLYTAFIAIYKEF
jgi:hypothetical protein